MKHETIFFTSGCNGERYEMMTSFIKNISHRLSWQLCSHDDVMHCCNVINDRYAWVNTNHPITIENFVLNFFKKVCLMPMTEDENNLLKVCCVFINFFLENNGIS